MKIIKAQLAKVLFEQSDEKVAAFVDKHLDVSKGPTETLKFLNSPEGRDPRVRAVLGAGLDDGSEKDESALLKATAVAVGGLVPTQIEIELMKSISWPLANIKQLKSMVAPGVHKIGPPGNDKIFRSGKLIIDGHHRWSSLFSVTGPGGKIASINLAIPENDAKKVLASMQVAIAATFTGGEEVPNSKAGGNNILGKSKEEIAKMIAGAKGKKSEAGVVLSDEFVQACIGDPAVRKHFGLKEGGDISDATNRIISVVSENLSHMKQPAEGAPPRTDMPQIDKAKGGVEAVAKALSSGEVNYKAPFEEETNESAESDDELVMERWLKLSGLLKG